MSLYPVVIVKDRYSGTYSGAVWTAFHAYAVPAGPADDDLSASEFWSDPGMPVGKGATPDEALSTLALEVHQWTKR